jgi:hypothetical protein
MRHTLLQTDQSYWSDLYLRVPESCGIRGICCFNHGPKKSFEMLLGTKEHEMQHRAQLANCTFSDSIGMTGWSPHLCRGRFWGIVGRTKMPASPVGAKLPRTTDPEMKQEVIAMHTIDHKYIS